MPFDLPLQPIPGGQSFGEADPLIAETFDPSVPAPSPGPLPAPAPVTTSAPTEAETAAQRRAGAAVLLAGVGVSAGALLGGLWGAGSGLFFSGAVLNTLRARKLWQSPGAQGEAVKTTVMTVLGIGLAGYLGYRAHQARNDDD